MANDGRLRWIGNAALRMWIARGNVLPVITGSQEVFSVVCVILQLLMLCH